MADEDSDEVEERYARMFRPGFVGWLFGWVETVDWEVGCSVIVAMFVFFGAIVWFVGFSFPTSDDARTRAVRLLKSHGYTHVVIKTIGVWDCGEHDVRSESSEFSAETATGNPVKGVICCGWEKDCTLRFK